MWALYGVIALVVSALFGLGIACDEELRDHPLELLFLCLLTLILFFAGLDWLNLIPEV